jgi:uncharacterized protein YecT (DUF1311 family)
MRIFSVFLLLVAFASAGVSQDDETKCCCTTFDMSVCLSKIRDGVDAELNTTYEKALAMAQRFTSEDVENLKDAERKWIAYRDAACKAEYSLWGKGSGGPNAHGMCVIRLTRQRTADLKSAYLDRLR